MELTFLLILSIVWLSYKLFKYLSVPVLDIVNFLNIKTPYATKLSIDKIGKHSITIHWENEPKVKKNGANNGGVGNDMDGRISHYILFMNNKQLAIFSNSTDALYTCCSINKLASNTEYRLDFVTVNNLGFINRLPTIYCMTKDANSDDFNTKIKKTTNNNWKRNATIIIDASLGNDKNNNDNTNNNNYNNNNNNNNNNSIINNNDTTNNSPQDTNENIPSYNRLMNLKDLENLTIPELRKILISSQEDLHYTTSQRTRTLDDFQESKIQLELELENYKNNWHHEMELRKSLKFNIKSLENSRTLYELKLSKINKNIEISKGKINKMENDMLNWMNDGSNLDDLNKTYSEKALIIKNDIQQITKKITVLKNELNEYGFLNKTLNNSSNKKLGTKELKEILQELDESISDETGLLAPNGQTILSKVTYSSSFYNLITDQLNIDSKLNSHWNRQQKEYLKSLSILDQKFKQVSLTNSQLRSNVLIQSYNQNDTGTANLIKDSTSNTNLTTLLPSTSNPILNTNLALGTSNKNSVELTGLGINLESDLKSSSSDSTARNNSNYENTGRESERLKSRSSINSERESLLSSQLNSNINNQFNQYSIPTTVTVTATATADKDNVVKNNASTTWTTENNTAADFSIGTEQDNQKFEYEKNNHVITGLQDLVYEDTDDNDRISNYSRGFTTDQLDNYWVNSRGASKEFIKSTLGDSYPMTPSPQANAFAFSNSNDFISPISSNVMPLNSYMINVSSHSAGGNGYQSTNQHYMSSSFNENMISPPYNDPISISNSNGFHNMAESPQLVPNSLPSGAGMTLFSSLQGNLDFVSQSEEKEYGDDHIIQPSNSITIGSRSRSQSNSESVPSNLIWNQPDGRDRAWEKNNKEGKNDRKKDGKKEGKKKKKKMFFKNN